MILDENSSYTKGANLAYTDGVATTIAIGEVLESTASKNTVKVKVTTGDFVVTDDYFIRSSNLIDSVGSKLLSTNSLSAGLNIFTINDHIALLKTNGSHGVGIGLRSSPCPSLSPRPRFRLSPSPSLSPCPIPSASPSPSPVLVPVLVLVLVLI